VRLAVNAYRNAPIARSGRRSNRARNRRARVAQPALESDDITRPRVPRDQCRPESRKVIPSDEHHGAADLRVVPIVDSPTSEFSRLVANPGHIPPHDLAPGPAEIQGEGWHVAPEIVDTENQFFRQMRPLTPDDPTDAERRQTVLVTRAVDGSHPWQHGSLHVGLRGFATLKRVPACFHGVSITVRQS
jgi:hypothetical protein